mgnify:CR=1 FL=1
MEVNKMFLHDKVMTGKASWSALHGLLNFADVSKISFSTDVQCSVVECYASSYFIEVWLLNIGTPEGWHLIWQLWTVLQVDFPLRGRKQTPKTKVMSVVLIPGFADGTGNETIYDQIWGFVQLNAMKLW